MSGPAGPPDRLRQLGPPFLLLTAGLLFLGWAGGLGTVAGLSVALLGAVLGAACRMSIRARWHPYGPLPPLVALATLAAFAPPTAVFALVGGAVALGYLVWLAEDPDRLPGGPRRALTSLWLTLVGLALAWCGAFLLPPGTAPLGVAALLLTGVLLVVALLLRTPEVYDRDAAAS